VHWAVFQNVERLPARLVNRVKNLVWGQAVDVVIMGDQVQVGQQFMEITRAKGC